VDPRKKLGVKIKHIIGQNHEPLLLGCTELFDPSAQLMEIVESCLTWETILLGIGGRPLHIIGVFLHVFTLPVCIVDWPDILRKTLASLKEQITCTKTFFVAYSAAGCKAGLIFHATSNFCDISC